MIQQLPGRWSFLETLGAQIGKRNMNQQEADQQAQVEARQRAGNLAQLAQAGVLNPDILSAQQASDLNMAGLPSSSVMDWSKMVRDRRKQEADAEAEKARQASTMVAANVDHVKAQTELAKAQAEKLGAPVAPKAPSRTDLESYTETYVRAAGVRGAVKLMDQDPQFSGWSPMQKGAWAKAIGQKIAQGPKEEKGLNGPAALKYHFSLASNAVRGAMEQLPPTAGEPNQAYRNRVLQQAINFIVTDPKTKDEFTKGLNTSHLFAAYDSEAKKDQAFGKRMSGGSGGGGKYLQNAKETLGQAGASGNPGTTPPVNQPREATQADVQAAVSAVGTDRAAVEAELKKKGLTIPKG